LIFAGIAAAQPLPKIELKQVFPNLQIDRPVWMSEAPDMDGEIYILTQGGEIYSITVP